MKIVIVLALVGVTMAMPGGWSSMSLDDPKANELASKAVAHHNKVSNNLFYKKLVTVKSIKSQVVAGVNYEVIFDIGVTECPKSDANSANCEVSANVSVNLISLFPSKQFTYSNQLSTLNC